MTNPEIMAKRQWTEAFAGLKEVEPEIREHLLGSSMVVDLPAGTRIFGPGQSPENYLLLLDGTVRVQQVSEGGREIVLYRIAAGESCALTTACLMGYEDYRAEALAEDDVRAVAIPRAAFDDAIARSPAFRKFVFTAFSVNVTTLFKLIEEVAFSRIDVRLAQRLLQLADARGRIELTHQQLAAELGSAREVIGRQLHEFQRRGWLTTSRGSIDLAQPEALRKLAFSH